MARKSVRVALAGIAAAAIVLSACGQPPTSLDPQAVPAPVVEPTVEPEPVEPGPQPSDEATSPEAPVQQVQKLAEIRKPTPQAGPAIMQQGNSSDRVKELQARLKQIGWFSGSVTGYYGTATRTAVAGFQAKRELPSNGAVDQTTWNRLVNMTRKPTADDLSNRPATPAAAASKQSNDSTAQRKASGLDPRCMTGRVVCISKKSNKLWWVNDGVVKMTMDARFGTTEFRTREGTFSVQWKSRDHVSNIYHTSMPYALFFSGGQAVHYSPDFAARGYSGGSHGCVNLRDRGGAQALFNQTRVGDKVVVYS